jgi:transcription termination factor NusB
MTDIDFQKINEMILVEQDKPAPTSIDEAIEMIKNSIDLTDLINKSGDLAIKTLEDARSAVEMTNQSRKVRNRLEETRTGILRPPIDFQRAINKVVKEVEAEFDKIEANLKEKLTVWMDSPVTFVGELFHSIDTEEGSMTRKRRWDFTYIDEESIPHSYMIPDKKKIQDAIKAGIRDIPGVDIFETEEICFRVKNE